MPTPSPAQSPSEIIIDEIAANPGADPHQGCSSADIRRQLVGAGKIEDASAASMDPKVSPLPPHRFLAGLRVLLGTYRPPEFQSGTEESSAAAPGLR